MPVLGHMTKLEKYKLYEKTHCFVNFGCTEKVCAEWSLLQWKGHLFENWHQHARNIQLIGIVYKHIK